MSTYFGIVAVLLNVNSIGLPKMLAKAVPLSVPPFVSCVDPKVHV